MPTSILVAYASPRGSTKEVAEAITSALRDKGLAVDCLPCNKVPSIDDYSGIVLGAPLYMFHWEKDAKGFLKRHQQALTQRPVALFALGPVQNVEKEFVDARSMLDKELVPFAWLAPIEVQVFGGKWDPAKLGFPLSLMPALRKMPASDIRDWAAIRVWAESLAPRLSPGR